MYGPRKFALTPFTSMAKVNLRSVTKSYGTLEVIHGVDLQVADGEFIVIVGPSGCGKSTLLRMVAGLEAITGGDIAIGDRVVNKLEPKDRDIAMVFQNYALYPHMSVFDNMAYGLRIRGFKKNDIAERVKRAADILELGPLLARTPRQLSGGQRQRVAMGRAIVREPAVFLFDEPLSNLDAKLRVQMRFEIQKLHRRLSTTSLYVTHDQVEAMTLAQRMVVMNAGRAEQIGSPMEVYENPQTMFVAGFIGSPAMNFIAGKGNGDGRISLTHGGHAKTSRGALENGRAVTVGIRPEHFVPCGEREAVVTGPVEMVENLGADALVHIGHGGNIVIARVPHGTSPDVGSTFCVTAEPARVFAFDAANGARLS
jgi:sn-glycerol 3-phosphate transport system ATP-binding protein